MNLARKVRWLAVTFLLPILYAAAAYVVTRHPKSVYVFAKPTEITVSEKATFTIYHAPDPIYPPRALHDRVEG